MLKTETKSYWVAPICYRNSPFPAFVYESARRDFGFTKQHHGSCHACRVSLFSVVVFSAIGPTGSPCSVQDIARHCLKQGADQNKRSHFPLHRPISQDAMANRCPGITPSRRRDTGSVVFVNFALLRRKCQMFSDKLCWNAEWVDCTEHAPTHRKSSVLTAGGCFTPPGFCCNVAWLHLPLSNCIYSATGLQHFK